MIKRQAVVVAIALVALRWAAPELHAQPADLVLCDRIAADPTDPDKPADIKGVSEIAPSDIATALKFCRTASASSRRALYELGRAHAANRQLAEAIAVYRKAADKGSTAAMVELAVMHANGTGLPRDDAQARKLLERAADAGNARAVANLAALSSNTGTQTDPVRARAALSKAAETNAEAQYQLGLLMADGAGGPKDDVAARALFEKAAAQGHAGALERMGAFTASGRGGAQDSTASKAYYEKAAALGNEDAKAALKRASCPVRLKNKQGQLVGDICW
jgi:TPR repeat protein